ncbi:MAG: methylglyoxal synthase [Lachnospiraceae bacterium]|nr:methylglyoxal synthase [Lachnospiraceae bacterium]MBR3004522.1 methylglyoxal synthase [Lachnospiraceae bacterium]MBR6350553.1 methylglyoxal synthase [Lachnospiraceae bacterium]
MNIGLVAHDSKKELMQNFCIAYKNILAKHELFATGTTGKLIEDATDLSIHKLLPGHLGGGRQMSVQIECNQIDAVIYLRDPVKPSGHEMDYARVYQLCDINNIPLATNLATAEILIMAINRGDLDWRNAYK